MPLVWPDRYRDQVEIVSDIERRLEKLKLNSELATVSQPDLPDRLDMAAAWSLKKKHTIQVPPYGKTQWFNPETNEVENLYINLPQYSINPFGVQTEAPVLSQAELIGRFIVHQEDLGVANYTATWTKTYRAIWFYWSVRSTIAAISSTFQIQPNALTGSIYSHSALKIDQTPAATFDSAYNNSNGWNIGNIPGLNAANPYLFGQGQGILYFPDATVQAKSGFFESLHLTSIGSGATELRYNNGGWHINTLQALTSLRFVPQGNFAVGSKIVVMGMHPQT